MAHAHDPDAVQESGNDIDAFTIGAVTVTGTFLVTAIIFLVQALDSNMQRREMGVKGRDRVELEAYKQEQKDKLAGYRWVDKDGGVAAVPIGDAMKIAAEKGGYAAPPEEEEPQEEPTPMDEGTGGGGGAGGDDGAGGGGGEDGDDEAPEEEAPEEETAPEAPAPAPDAPPAPVPAAPAPPAPAPAPAPGDDIY